MSVRSATAACVFLLGIALAACSAQAQDRNAEGQRNAARRAAIASARGEVTRAQAQLQAATERVRATWKANPELTAAETALAAAQADLEKAAAPVLARLKEADPAYQAILEEEIASAKRLAEEHARLVDADPASTQPATTRPATDRPDDGITAQQEEDALNVPVPSDAQVVAAVDKLDQRSKRRQLEEQAIAADPSTTDALQRVESATADLKALKAQFDAALLNDPDYRAARDSLANARGELQRAAGANY